MRLAQHESTLERDCIVLLDWDWRVRRIAPQPFVVHYVLDGRARRYTPDIQADFDDGSAVWSEVYEVKYRDDLREHWAELKPRFRAARAWCRQRDWRFRLLTEREIRIPALANVRFLRAYRDQPSEPSHEEALVRSMARLGPCRIRELLKATWPSERDRVAGIPALWKMVGQGRLVVDIAGSLTVDSPVQLPADGHGGRRVP